VNDSVSGDDDKNNMSHITGGGRRTNADPITNTNEDDANNNARMQQYSLDRPQIYRVPTNSPLAGRSNISKWRSIDSSLRLVKSLHDTDGYYVGRRRRSIHSSIRIGEGGVGECVRRRDRPPTGGAATSIAYRVGCFVDEKATTSAEGDTRRGWRQATPTFELPRQSTCSREVDRFYNPIRKRRESHASGRRRFQKMHTRV
jgi:hypothetical protein